MYISDPPCPHTKKPSQPAPQSSSSPLCTAAGPGEIFTAIICFHVGVPDLTNKNDNSIERVPAYGTYLHENIMPGWPEIQI